MANFISEIFSIIVGILSKTAFIAFPILFMSSLLLKMNWIHHSGFMITMFLLIFNVTLAYGWVYIVFYIIVRGIGGHFVPKGLPPFPYFMTSPQVQHINYLKTGDKDIKELPRVYSSDQAYSQENYDGNLFINMVRWVFPKSSVRWSDKYLKGVLETDTNIILEIQNDGKDCGSYLRYYDLNPKGAQ